jgi:hydroxypyruvate isomerase
MERREFLAAGLAAGAATLAASGKAGAQAAAAPAFKLKYAPHFGMFTRSSGRDFVEQLDFMAAQGFTALEDNGLPGRSVEDQERIGAALARLGMTMGVFVASASFEEVTFASNDPAMRERLVGDMQRAVEVAKRVNAKWCTVVPGRFDIRTEWDYQTANVVENLKHCAAVCEPHGLVMVLEPLNAWRDHPGLFLTKIPQAYMICKAVGSPSCKILDDLYHQQITEGNLIPNMEMAWEEIAYIQVGDNPGRKEPTTGEINYKNIFQWLHKKGFQGVVGMEHGNSKPGKEGEQAVIDAYRLCDDFEV